MIQEICRNTAFLALPSEPAGPQDAAVGQDLLDTLLAHRDECVGMAGNMIGRNRRVIVFDNEGTAQLMYNPEILKKSGPYKAQEGCLSLAGKRTTTRYKSIKVQYLNEQFQLRIKTYTGWTAQIIQHEIDHLQGILI